MDKQLLERLLGPKPENAPLEALTVEAEDCGTYRREKIAYNTEPGDRITAYTVCANRRLDISS